MPGIRGDSAAFFRLTASSMDQQLLELLSPDGGDLPGFLGLAIVRVQ